MKRRVVLLLSAVLIYPIISWACGTIDMRYENYEKAQNDEQRFTELKFMSCKPIVESYKGDPKQGLKLYDLIQHGISRGNEMAKMRDSTGHEWKSLYYKDLALKMYIRFGLNEEEPTKMQSETLWLFKDAYGIEAKSNLYEKIKSLESTHWLKTDQGLQLSHEGYAEALRKHSAQLLAD